MGKREPVSVVSLYGARKQKRNINMGGVAQTSGPSRIHQDCPDNFAIEYEEKIDEIRQGKDGRFRRNLSQDIRGLMELYEAAQLSFHGEYILDEAASFSSQLLYECCSADVDDNLSRMVIGRLRYPYHKTIARLTRKDFLQDLDQGVNRWRKTLRELALIDLRKGQSVYQGELAQVSEWWNELGLSKNLKLVRNQLPKWYTWSMSVLIDDFSLSLQRVELTKSTAFIYLIDDIFDVVGTLDELTIFTEAVNKWEYGAVDMLPDYMKMCYRALLDTINDMGREIYKRHGHNPIDSLKQSWASLCNAYLVEAKMVRLWVLTNSRHAFGKWEGEYRSICGAGPLILSLRPWPNQWWYNQFA
ncbi:UNVERIFIED_CONTAM: Tricyclene synthase 0e23, chloroplastic [Sesamum radiatum]|uniref:Tricyclene synthase 0e23, chloroplastic n=1 Tax=Sesamum radiatum TaxID=300843 RepID=A0AAW2KG04_SESRA